MYPDVLPEIVQLVILGQPYEIEMPPATIGAELPVTVHPVINASLLGEKKALFAISKLEKLLDDKSIPVMIVASKALLKMDNRKGVKALEEFCEKASKEFEDGKYEKLVDHSDALRALADAGESSAIPYLRELLGHESWSIRLAAVRSFSKLYEKNTTVLADIASMLEDNHPQIRKYTFESLQKIETNK